MVWSHCEIGGVLDDAVCPSCGMSKAEWTVRVEATRTFTISTSKAKKKDEGWLELTLLDPDGAPACDDVDFHVDLPSGRRVTGRLVSGEARLDALPAGACLVTVEGLRPREPAATDDAGARWLVAEPGDPDEGSGLEHATSARLVLRRCHWIELAAGASFAREPFALEFDDGTPRVDGRLDDAGVARVDGLLLGGPCEVVFPGRTQGELEPGGDT